MRILFSVALISFLFAGCVKNNQDPAWIEISEWDLQENPNSANQTGVLTSNITNAWVYMDGDVIGVFELPVKLPLLKDGTHNFKIYPAILNNGISATKKIYPFLEPYDITLDLVKNETVAISPTTRYYSNVKFWIEDFEDASPNLVDGNSTIAHIEKVDVNDNDPVFNASINEGGFGRIKIDETNYIWIGSTTANNGTLNMNLPRGQEVYLEIDYHNTISLTTGVLAIDGSGVAKDNVNIRLNSQKPSEVKWKKIYIDLREIVSSSTNASYFEFSFKTTLDNGKSEGEVNIDNIKAVYF